MNLRKPRSATALCLLALGYASSGFAQSATTASETTGNDVTASKPIFFVSQKFWSMTWDVPLLDANVVLPGPVLKPSPRLSKSSTELIPITTLGARYKDFVVSGNIYGQKDFSTDGQTIGKVKRDEFDISLGYAIQPNLIASIVYKGASISDSITRNAAGILGQSDSSYKVTGWLVGLSGAAPLSGPLSLYANFALGSARQAFNGPNPLGGPTTFNGTYRIGEVGLSYRLIEPNPAALVKSLSLQLGYRAQVTEIRDLPYPIYSIPPGPFPVSAERLNVRSTAEGLVFGLVAAF